MLIYNCLIDDLLTKNLTKKIISSVSDIEIYHSWSTRNGDTPQSSATRRRRECIQSRVAGPVWERNEERYLIPKLIYTIVSVELNQQQIQKKK